MTVTTHLVGERPMSSTRDQPADHVDCDECTIDEDTQSYDYSDIHRDERTRLGHAGLNDTVLTPYRSHDLVQSP